MVILQVSLWLTDFLNQLIYLANIVSWKSKRITIVLLIKISCLTHLSLHNKSGCTWGGLILALHTLNSKIWRISLCNSCKNLVAVEAYPGRHRLLREQILLPALEVLQKVSKTIVPVLSCRNFGKNVLFSTIIQRHPEAKNQVWGCL